VFDLYVYHILVHVVSRVIIVALYAQSFCMPSWCVQGHLYLNSYLTVFRTSAFGIYEGWNFNSGN